MKQVLIWKGDFVDQELDQPVQSFLLKILLSFGHTIRPCVLDNIDELIRLHEIVSGK